jgi:tRNA pseudouridine38-40 synthase
VPVYRLDVAYDGTGFRGYARQEGLRTVQGELETALATLTGHGVETSVAGRTDAGVHARGQVVSFQHDDGVDLGRLRRGLNGILGPEIAVWSVREAPEDFNARFSALWRRYLYRLDMRPVADPLSRSFVWHVGRDLDLEAMITATSPFVGEHDFSSFCRSAEGRSNVRRLTELSIRVTDDTVEVWAEANAFCHQMVRSMVGYLYDVGRGFCDAGETAVVIASRDRGRVATVAPPHGLILHEVGYEVEGMK